MKINKSLMVVLSAATLLSGSQIAFGHYGYGYGYHHHYRPWHHSYRYGYAPHHYGYQYGPYYYGRRVLHRYY